MNLDAVELQSWLMRYQFWWLEFLAIVTVVTTIRVVPEIRRALGVGAAWWVGLAAVGVWAAGSVILLPPTTNRIYYDEQIYQNVGQSMADSGRTQFCNYGYAEYGRLDCVAGEYNKEPAGYPYVLSLAYRAVGTSDLTAHHVNRTLHVLTALLVAVAAIRLGARPSAGLWGAAIFSLIPEQLRWSATAAAEPAAACFTLAAVLAAAHHVDARSTRSLAWLAAMGAWALQFRPESGLVVIVAAAILVAEAPAALRDRRLVRAGALLLPAALVFVAHLAAVRHDSWGASGPAFSTTYLLPNLGVNGWFYVWDDRFPPLITALAVAGLLTPHLLLRRRLVWLVYFLVFWGVFLFFYAGSYNYGADVRYSLLSYAPLTVLAGLGAAAISETWWASRLGRGPARLAVAGFLIVAALRAWPHARSTGEEAWAARADVAFAKEIAGRLPADALVLTHDPNMFFLWGKNAAQMSFAVEPGFIERVRARHGDHVYVHWGFWCNVADQVQQRLCREAIGGRPVEILAERRERDYRYLFYQVPRPSAERDPRSPAP